MNRINAGNEVSPSFIVKLSRNLVVTVGLLLAASGPAQIPLPDGGGDTNGGGDYAGITYTPPDYGTNLYLQGNGLSNDLIVGQIRNSSQLTPYTLFSRPELTLPYWSPAATFYGDWSTNFTMFTVPRLGRGMLFLRAVAVVAPRIIAAGSSHNAVIRRDGTVWAWGSNGNGQLGDGTWNGSAVPVPVAGLSNIIALASPAGGNFTLALDAGGNVWSWGQGDSGQLGRADGHYASTNLAAPVPGLSNIVAIAAGTTHSLALKSDGTVWVWGDNTYDQLGSGDNTSRDYAAPVSGLTDGVSIAAGADHNFVLGADGQVWGWGYNQDGELGLGNTTDQASPVPVSGLTNAIALGGGYAHSIALLSDGTVEAWGLNYLGEIGSLSSTTPAGVSGLSNIVFIACGNNHNLFLDHSNQLWVWGNDDWGQLGDNGANISTNPFQLTSVSNVTAIAGGETSSMISTADGSLYVWGNGGFGQQSTPSLVNLYTNYSTDGSGLSDWWELQYFGHLGVSTNADPDGDNWNNWQEYVNGSNPTNFDAPAAVSGLTVQSADLATVTLTWDAETPTPASYAIYRTDYDYNAWQYHSPQPIGTVAGNVTTFTDNGSIAGGDGNSVYSVAAVYAGGLSPVSAPTYVNGVTPAALTPSQPLNVQLARNQTGRWQLMFGDLPSDVQTLRLYWNDTPQDIAAGSVVNGVYPIPDGDVVNALSNTVSVMAIATNGATSATVLAGVIPNDAPYFVDGRRHMKQNLSFLIQGAGINLPYMGVAWMGYPLSGNYHQSATNFEEFSFLHHGSAGVFLENNRWTGGYSVDEYYSVLDNLWPFSANYDLENFFLDTGAYTNLDQVFGVYPLPVQFHFQPDFATSIPAPPVLAHASPYWIIQPGFFWLFSAGVSSPALLGLNVADAGLFSGYNTSVTLSNVNNLFGLPCQTGCLMKENRHVIPYLGPDFQTIGAGDTVSLTLAEQTNGWIWEGYASQCPAPALVFSNYYFAPLVNLLRDSMYLPGSSPEAYEFGLDYAQYPTPIDDTFNVTNQTPAVMFGSVGQPMILGAWAKYAIANGAPDKFAYLGQYFTTNAFTVGANGNLTGTNTGVVSPYGEFFPTEPGPAAMITMPDIDTGMQSTGIVQVIALALDANHDGAIDPTYNSPDFTSANRPFKFWLNNNYDRTNYDANDSAIYEDDVQTGSNPGTDAVEPDCNYSNVLANGHSYRAIPTERDLQDFARLWICGLTSNTLAALSTDCTVTLNWGDVGNPNPNNPTIDLFTAADADGGMSYLTNETVAAQQTNAISCPYIGRLAPGQSIQLNASTFANNWAGNYFIWCGVSSGTGGLNLTITDAHSNVLAKTTAYIQLVDIKQMYERWTVGDNPSIAPATTAQIATSDLPTGTWPFRYTKPADASTPYILFVHGWNMETWEKDRFAESVFKRLYWQGYQGRFGEFRWPTDFGFNGLWQIIATNRDEKDNFDRSEYQAWQSGQGLLNKLNDLNSQYPGHVYMLAHSMGNIVANEALRLAGNSQVVNTYVASQAAVTAHTYDTNVPNYSFVYFAYGVPLSLSPDTPNIYGNWFAGNGGAAGAIVNFYNTNDYALSRSVWQLDQLLKPDQSVSEGTERWSYGYSSSVSDPPPWNNFYKQDTNSTTYYFNIVTSVKNRYEVMAFDAQPYTTALGATPGVLNITKNVDLMGVWPSDPSGKNYSQHFWHSAEFEGDYAQQQGYWRELLGSDAFNLK